MPVPLEPIDSVPEIRESLLGFFDTHARDLPWRVTHDPYGIWVSEVMLQQTRVDTVVPFYTRWMKRFPTVTALADASLERVLESWAGLGYYSRARNLHAAAQVVRERHNGSLPADAHALRALPGIGEYTAGAVASIAFGIRTPAVDGNVRRVLSRLFDIERPTQATLRRVAFQLVDPERPGDFNQSLMELGATVCVPRNPRCGACPIEGVCRAVEMGTVADRPPVRAPRIVPKRSYAVAVVRWLEGNNVVTVLRRRPTKGLLGGMLEFPSTEIPIDELDDTTPDAETHVAASIVTALSETNAPDRHSALPNGVKLPLTPRRLSPVRHRFSHFAATYHPFLFEQGPVLESRRDDVVVSKWDDLEEAALPTAQRRIMELAEKVPLC